MKSPNPPDLFAKDLNGYNALNYLFINANLETKQNLIQLIEKIDFNSYKWHLFSNQDQNNLLHYSTKMGISQCVNYLLTFIDPNTVNADNHSPLSLAILNGHRDCALILLKSEKIRILENLEFISKNNIKINLLWHIWKNDWKGLFFEK